MFEQEDGENWQLSTAGSVSTGMRKYPLNYTMGVGHGEVINDELTTYPRIEAHHANEHYMRWIYRAWAEWLEADSWRDLKRNHTSPSAM